MTFPKIRKVAIYIAASVALAVGWFLMPDGEFLEKWFSYSLVAAGSVGLWESVQ
tara:strand:- start:1387 stop:1548 length:162 start_codon:yes stop_codon:yes gene_type:complete